MMTCEMCLVMCQVPSESVAEQIAQALLAARLAACVTLQPRGRSFYRWQGQLEVSEEIVLLIKTRRARYAELERVVLALHPYDVPEIVVCPVIDGLSAYVQWVCAETHDIEV